MDNIYSVLLGERKEIASTEVYPSQLKLDREFLTIGLASFIYSFCWPSMNIKGVFSWIFFFSLSNKNCSLVVVSNWKEISTEVLKVESFLGTFLYAKVQNPLLTLAGLD